MRRNVNNVRNEFRVIRKGVIPGVNEVADGEGKDVVSFGIEVWEAGS